jgi:predicted homoserine dehydrogenase-like protein
MDTAPLRIGVVGTGFVARHFVHELLHRTGYRLGRVLTRRPLGSCGEFPAPEALTDSLDALIESADIVFECTGDVPWATETVEKAMAAGRPVVTLNPEFHVTTGSHFVPKGLLSEAEGDQPGCQASLLEEVRELGFAPLVLGNIKGFLNRHPTPEDMRYWALRQGISTAMVISFTDGTKLQVEQALVANGLGADIARSELLGPATDELKDAARLLGEAAVRQGGPISDYVVSAKLPHGVFVVGTHKDEQKAALRYLKMGEGPYYTVLRPNIFVHLEVFRTLERVVRTGTPLLNNTAAPRIGVAAVAKRELRPGELIARGYGSFDMRGICVRIVEHPGHLPIGLAERARIRRRIEPGQIVDMADVELPPSRALECWQAIERKAVEACRAA